MAGRKTNLSGFNSIKRQQELERDWDEDQTQIKFYVSSEIILYSIEDIIRMSGWSETTVQRLFNDPRFPAIDYGKRKLVENHALMRFLSVRHEKARDWRQVIWLGSGKQLCTDIIQNHHMPDRGRSLIISNWTGWI